MADEWLSPEDLRAIIWALLRIEEKLDELLGEDDEKTKRTISPETRAVLEDLRRGVRGLIELLQAKLDARR